MNKLEITTKIIAGFCANPAVFGPNGMTGWNLVNCNEGELVNYAFKIANEIIKQNSESINQTFGKPTP